MINLPVLEYNPNAHATDGQLDIETLGTGNDAKMIALACVLYNRHTGEVVSESYYRFDARMMPGSVDRSTLAWWAAQDPKVFAEAITGTQHPIEALEDFVSGIPRGIKMWGNGATFDAIIVESALKAFNVRVPWVFWDVRDLRTLLDLAEVTSKMFAFEGDKHNALADARHQTKMALHCKRLITGALHANRG